MADNGADVVLCQHSHCIGCYEEYNGSHILYGQGNFHFENAGTEYRPAGTTFEYDSGGSFVMEALVERLTGKTLLEYLRKNVLIK